MARCLCALLLPGLAQAQTAPPESAAPAGAVDTRRQLHDTVQDRRARLATQRAQAERARAALARAATLATARIAAAARLQAAERQTAEAGQRMQALAQARAAATAALAQRTADLAPLLPVIERLAEFPGETLLAVPASPEDALRGALVLGGIGREMERAAEALRRQQAEVDRLGAAMAAEAPHLAAAEAAQAAEAAALDEQMAEARASAAAAQDTAADAAAAAAADAARAADLRAALARIAFDERAAAARARAEAARAARHHQPAAAAAATARAVALSRPAGPGLAAGSHLTPPVAGRLLHPFGAPTDAGPAEGASFQPLPGARVVAPCGGVVAFAAPFRSYGQLLILDCGGGYHVVLAGLGRLDVGVGGRLAAGEPVGIMPGGSASLYVELRHDGRAIDPAPWLLAAR
nr:septal ring factor EnvC [uncultured Alphaproteobacteria bacterium]